MAEIPNREVLDRLAAAEAENVVLREALKPFADYARGASGNFPDSTIVTRGSTMARRQVVTLGDCRAAARLASSPARGSGLEDRTDGRRGIVLSKWEHNQLTRRVSAIVLTYLGHELFDHEDADKAKWQALAAKLKANTPLPPSGGPSTPTKEGKDG